MAKEVDNLVNALKNEVPGFGEILKVHLHNYEEILPHVLLAELVPWIEERAITGDFVPGTIALRILDEAFRTKEPYVQELVSVSFLEILSPANPLYQVLRGQMTRECLEQLKAYEMLR